MNCEEKSRMIERIFQRARFLPPSWTAAALERLKRLSALGRFAKAFRDARPGSISRHTVPRPIPNSAFRIDIKEV